MLFGLNELDPGLLHQALLDLGEAFWGKERYGALELSPQRCQSVGVHLIDALLAGPLIEDEAGILEHLQVLRDGRPADGKVARQFGHRAWVLDQQLKDRPPGRISQRRKGICRVSHR